MTDEEDCGKNEVWSDKKERCIQKAKIIVKQTFDIITEESSKIGDFSESGWEDEEGKEFERPEDVAEYLEREGVIEASSSVFHPGVWYSTEGHMDMYSGETRIDSYHISNAKQEEEKEIYDMIFKRRK